MASSPARRRAIVIVAILAALALVAGVLVWRGSADDGAEEAEALAATLADGGTDLDDQVLGALREAGATPEVTLADAGEAEDGTRTATYDWTWTLPEDAGTWEYSTTATLERGEDGWAPQLVPSALAPDLADDETLDVRAVDRAADAAAGYPFMIQLVGYYTLKSAAPTGSVDVAAVDAGINAGRRRLGRLVHATALRPLSDVDRTYLLAMAQDDGPSRTGEIAKRMGVTAQYAGEYRRRLIRDGIIEPAGHGKVRFTIPYTADHLREHAAHDALEGLTDQTP